MPSTLLIWHNIDWPTHKTISHHSWSMVSFSEIASHCSRFVLRIQNVFAFGATSAVVVHVVRKYMNHSAVLSSKQLFSPSTRLQFIRNLFKAHFRISPHYFNDGILYVAVVPTSLWLGFPEVVMTGFSNSPLGFASCISEYKKLCCTSLQVIRKTFTSFVRSSSRWAMKWFLRNNVPPVLLWNCRWRFLVWDFVFALLVLGRHVHSHYS